MLKFNVTYEIVTPESAEHGDAAECGFVSEDVSLRDALDDLQGEGCHVEANEYPVSAPSWVTAYDTNDGTASFYEDGEHESRSLHFPDTMTASSKLRVCRLLNCYGTNP